MDGSLSPSSSARRRRIVEAAIGLFANAPYASVRMDAIAAAAIVAKPTLYRYFPTKEALFVAALEGALDDLGTALREIRQETSAGAVKLRRVVALILGRVEHLAPAIQAIENQDAEWGTESRRVLRRGFRNLREEISAIVRDGTESGEFAAADPDLASLIILGGIRTASHVLVGRGASLADSMADLFLSGLRGPGGQSSAPILPATSPGAVA